MTSHVNNIFHGFYEHMERIEPGYGARAAARRAAARERDRLTVEAGVERYGSIKAIFARSDREDALYAALLPFSEEETVEDIRGTSYACLSVVDGASPFDSFWLERDFSERALEAARGALPWPDTLRGMLGETRVWYELNRLRQTADPFFEDRAEVACRMVALETALAKTAEATSWDDVLARIEWQRWKEERVYENPEDGATPFLYRIEGDIRNLTAR